MLRDCVAVWPSFEARTMRALEDLRPRTEEHPRRRGLLEREPAGVPPADDPAAAENKIALVARQRCMMEYNALTRTLGYQPSTQLLSKKNTNLYRRIQKHWGPFSAFRQDAGLPSKGKGEWNKPSARLRERCIREYGELATRLGRNSNTAELNVEGSGQSERIRLQWGGFPEFCDDLRIAPARRHRSDKASAEARRALCRAEYEALMERLRYAPSSWELQQHTDGLYRCIKKVWRSFEAFCDDIGAAPARMRRKRLVEEPRTAFRPCAGPR